MRVWFCNKRQSLKHCQSFQRSRINLKSSDSTEEDRNSASPTQPWGWTNLSLSLPKFCISKVPCYYLSFSFLFFSRTSADIKVLYPEDMFRCLLSCRERENPVGFSIPATFISHKKQSSQITLSESFHLCSLDKTYFLNNIFHLSFADNLFYFY